MTKPRDKLLLAVILLTVPVYLAAWILFPHFTFTVLGVIFGILLLLGVLVGVSLYKRGQVGQAPVDPRETARLERQKLEQQGREQTDQPASMNRSESQERKPWWRKVFGT